MPEFRLDHVAVALHSFEPAVKLYRDALGGEYLMGGDGGESWRWLQFRWPGGGKVELLEPRGEGFLTRFLERRGEGLHHVTFKTDDIEAAIARVRAHGYELVDVNLENPHWREAFLRPSGAHGTLIQIAQSDASDEEAASRSPSRLEDLLGN
ncbi:MAG TPA: VOC family protein [Thermoleophilaceae bacterium]|jgi:methylmalonyl-CoA epimerase